MRTLPLIDATTPTEVPAAPAKTYDRWVVTSVMFNAGDPSSGKYAATANLSKAFNKGDQTLEISTVDEPVQLVIPDIFALASEDPELVAVMIQLIQYIGKYGVAQGKL